MENETDILKYKIKSEHIRRIVYKTHYSFTIDDRRN